MYSRNRVPSLHLTGHWQNTRLLPGHSKTDKIEYDDKHASNSDFSASEIPAPVHVPPAARAKCGFGVPEGLRRSRAGLL